MPETAPVRFFPASFADLPGWSDADPRLALQAFVRGCKTPTPAGARCAPLSPSDATRTGDEGARSAPLPIDNATLCEALARACSAAATADAADAAAARAFFGRHFTPYRVVGRDGPEGLFTGYYEPQLAASRRRRAGFDVPIYAPPPGTALPIRAEIENGTAASGWKVLFWAADPVDVFTLHIQGSGRLALAEGGFARVSYAGNNGHGYVAVGRLMRERGLLPADGVNMPAIAAWLRANPAAGRALMQENPRYIFFREIADTDGPRGQTGAMLTALASLAVDPAFIPLGLPLWLDTHWPLEREKPLRALVVAQDVGAAIKGPVRGDLYFGAGAEAARLAGHMAARGRYFLLLPTGL